MSQLSKLLEGGFNPEASSSSAAGCC